MTRESDPHEPWLVGALFSRTGVTAVIAATQRRGTFRAIGAINASGSFGITPKSRRAVIPDPYLAGH
jgi:hypothetical protein